MKDTCEAKLISVIVPVHNVARYLVQCVESICSQTYKNLQIILIEDGSTDGSDRICDEFDDPRIEVIHSTTRGLSAARNVGIGRAKGELIAFVDSDDYLTSSNMYTYTFLASASFCQSPVCVNLLL